MTAGGRADSPVEYVNTEIRSLVAGEDAALMSGVRKDGSRSADSTRVSRVFGLQSYVMQNNRTLSAGITGENTLYAPVADSAQPSSADAIDLSEAKQVFATKLVRDGSIRGFLIKDADTNRDLLKIHFHGDTTNPVSRLTKAFFRSPVIKWDVENYGLFSNMPIGKNLGLIRDVFGDHRVFTPANDFTGVPQLEMQSAASLGRQYYLAVGGIPEPVGEVRSGLTGRFAQRSEQYIMTLRNCTREEAVLWVTMLVATDMKRRKSTNTSNQPFGVFF